MATSESAETAQGTSSIPEDTPAHRENGAFKAWKTKADIDRLQAKIGQDTLTLAHEDYRHQPVGKSNRMGFNFGDPKQNHLIDTGKVSEYVGDKENWSNVRENNSVTAPLRQLPLAFDQPAAAATSRNVPDAQRVRMESTGRLDRHAGRIQDHTDAARLISQHSTGTLIITTHSSRCSSPHHAGCTGIQGSHAGRYG